jgi:hypothetical protein
MNYRIVLEVSVNNDESDQPHPTLEEITEAVYKNRVFPDGIIYDVKHLEVDRF